MPITTTITSTDYWTAGSRETITSAKWNAHMGIWRGHLLPVDGSTSAAANGSYDLGSVDHKWRNAYATSFYGKPGYSFSTITAALSITTQHIILCDASTAAYTCTLPAANVNTGTSFIFTKIDSGFNIVTIDGNGSEQINDTTTTNIATYGEMLELICDGAKWYKKSRYIDSRWNDYTPTGSWNTNVTYYGAWKRCGSSIEIFQTINCSGPPNTANLYVYPPSGIVLDTSKLPGFTTTGLTMFGQAEIVDVGNNFFPGRVNYYQTTTGLLVSCWAAGNTYSQVAAVAQNAPFTFGDGDSVIVRYAFPVTGWGA